MKVRPLGVFLKKYVWLEPKAQSNDLTRYNLDQMSEHKC